MATSDNFPRRSRPEEFPERESVSAASVNAGGKAHWNLFADGKSDTATDLLSRERIVYAYMRSLRERI